MTRTGGTTGQITADYSISYLPPGTADPDMGLKGVVVAGGGSVVMAAGQSQADLTETIFSSAFTEPGAQLHVEINGTELTGGGMRPLDHMT